MRQDLNTFDLSRRGEFSRVAKVGRNAVCAFNCYCPCSAGLDEGGIILQDLLDDLVHGKLVRRRLSSKPGILRSDGYLNFARGAGGVSTLREGDILWDEIGRGGRRGFGRADQVVELGQSISDCKREESECAEQRLHCKWIHI